MEHLCSFTSHAKTSKVVRDRVLRSLCDGKGFLTITPAWLPTFGENGMETIHYNPHRVRRQFGLDQDVPSANVVVFNCDTVMAPFIIIRASKYWSDLSIRVTIPAGYDIVSISEMPKIPLTNPRLKPYSLSLTTYSRKEGCGFAEWDVGCHSWIVHGKAMSSRCQEAESALLAMPLKQGKALSMREPVVAPEISRKKNQTSCKKRKTVALATSSTNSTNGEGSNKKAHENDDTNPLSHISGKANAGDSADLRKSKPVVLAICAAPIGSNVIASSPIATTIQPWDITSSSLPSQANVFTTTIIEKVTDNTRSSEVDLAIQRCGETPHGVSSPLVVGVTALGNTHPCHLNFGSAHSLAMNIVERDAPVSIVEKNDFDLIQGDFGSFLSRLNETRANLRIASHFWSFSKAKENFLHFSVPAEATPLLEKLLLKHGNFMGGFKLGTGFGDFLLALLAAVLMDIHHTLFDLLGEGELFEWMDAVRDLMTIGVAVGFLLHHIRNFSEMWFTQKAKRKQLTSLSSKIAKMEEELLTLKSEWEKLCAAIPATPTADMPLSNGLF
uniref:Aminotransferase-like plant mobile domain-containing protein n=1 Tax=Fagus sylvatica TaxID=28930 RepID=A0A2N9IAV8_FAGSY